MDAPDALTPSPELVDVFLENTHIYESGDYESD